MSQNSQYFKDLENEFYENINEDTLVEVIADCKIQHRYRDVDIIRELAKRPEMRMMFSVAKSSDTPLFDGPVSEWNILQQRLVYWLSFYSNIEGAYERPPARILKNDSMLDNWVQEKAREAERRHEEKWLSGGSAGIKKSAYDHDEVYEL